MKKMILKVEDLEERIAPGLFLNLGEAPGEGSGNAAEAASGEVAATAEDAHSAAAASGVISHSE